MCFVVSRSRRGSGIATALLEAAIDYAARAWRDDARGLPARARRARIPAAKAYGGHVGMFEKAGFEVVVRRQANASSAPPPIVRRAVSPGLLTPSSRAVYVICRGPTIVVRRG